MTDFIPLWTYFFKGLVLLSISKLVIAKKCMESIETVTTVSDCPRTQDAWEKAATRKNCAGIKNSCPSFVYHCVMNTWQNETVEVCAPQRIIHDKKCAEYNFLGVKVQRNAKVKCNQCPRTYNSTETFKYPECYPRPIVPSAEREVKVEKPLSGEAILKKKFYFVRKKETLIRQTSDETGISTASVAGCRPVLTISILLSYILYA